MRTNIVIDDRLMADAMAANGFRTKKDAVEAGLKLLVQVCQQAKIRSLRGKVAWQGDLGAMRSDT